MLRLEKGVLVFALFGAGACLNWGFFCCGPLGKPAAWAFMPQVEAMQNRQTAVSCVASLVIVLSSGWSGVKSDTLVSENRDKVLQNSWPVS